MPFRVAFVSFMSASLYVFSFLPYIDPVAMSGSRPGSAKAGFLAPLRILKPQLARLVGGRLAKHYGVVFLCAGIFTGVVATGYAPLLIQMYATAAFNFSQADNGLMMSEFSFVRSLFLIFAFPCIIAWGRHVYSPRRKALAVAAAAAAAQRKNAAGKADKTASLSGSTTPKNSCATPSGYGATDSTDDSSALIMPTHPEEVEVMPANAVEVEVPPVTESAEERSHDEGMVDLSFDLVFLRWSLVVDGALTTLAAFATQKWHIYLGEFFFTFHKMEALTR